MILNFIKTKFLIQSITSLVFATGLGLTHTAIAIPLVSDPTHESNNMHWPTISKEGFGIDISFHIQRVRVLARSAAEKIGASPDLAEYASLDHDKSKPEVIDELYKIHGQSGMEKHPAVKVANARDKDYEAQTKARMQMFGHTRSEILSAMMAVDLADKVDRYMFPRLLSKMLFGVISNDVTSPEFAKVMEPTFKFLDIHKFAEKFEFEHPEILRNTIESMEREYMGNPLIQSRIPKHVYSKICFNLFR